MRTQIRPLVTLILVAAAVDGFVLPGPATSAEQGAKEQQAQWNPGQEQAAATQPAVPPVRPMRNQHMETLTKLKVLLTEAKAAVQGGESADAVGKLDEALNLVEKDQQAWQERMARRVEMMRRAGRLRQRTGSQAAEHGVVNVRCPIDGAKIDPASVPEAQTRQWKGKTVGFCCANCAAAWDKLTDEQKDQQLKAVMPEMMEHKQPQQEQKEEQPEGED